MHTVAEVSSIFIHSRAERLLFICRENPNWSGISLFPDRSRFEVSIGAVLIDGNSCHVYLWGGGGGELNN